MKLTLMVEGSAAVIAAVLAALPNDGTATVQMPTAAPADDDDNGPVNASAPATDVNGLPWDERIHSASKATVANGSWRRRKGVADDLVQSVEAELRTRQAAQPLPPVAPVAPPPPVPMPIPPAAAVPAPVPLPVPPVAAPIPAPVPLPVPIPEPVAAPAPVPPVPVPTPEPVAAPAPAPAPTGELDFAGFMQHIQGQFAKLNAEGKPLIDVDYLAGITAEISTAFAPHGVPALTAITDIASNPQMIQYAVALLQRDQRWS